MSATGAPESAATSFTLQRTGAAIIRNELTSRRTRLEAGEAYFMPSGDPFLRYAVGSDPSIIWVIELLPPEAAAPGAATTGTVLFTSDAINDYPRGTFDVELQRGILLPGEVSELPPHTGPALMMVTSGPVAGDRGWGPAGADQRRQRPSGHRCADTPQRGHAARRIRGGGARRAGRWRRAARGGARCHGGQAVPTPVPGQPVPTVLLPPVDAAPTAVAPTPQPPAPVVEPTPVPDGAGLIGERRHRWRRIERRRRSRLWNRSAQPRL